MAEVTSNLQADWQATLADPGGPRRHILGSFDTVEEYFYNESNLTRREMSELRDQGPREKWGARLWRKLKADDNDDDICNIARVLDVGQAMRWIDYNTETEEFTMNQQFSTEYESLMWQVAISNWETTKKDLTLTHLNTMFRIGLHNLAQAVQPLRHSAMEPESVYSVEEVEKALAKVTLLVTELNERMRQTKHGALPEPKKS